MRSGQIRVVFEFDYKTEHVWKVPIHHYQAPELQAELIEEVLVDALKMAKEKLGRTLPTKTESIER